MEVDPDSVHEEKVHWLPSRQAGVLLHVSSLPGPGRTGELDENAYRFVDFLVESGIGVWQTLPVGPTQTDGSPYSTHSIHAGNVDFVSLGDLTEAGFLSPAEIPTAPVERDAKLALIDLAWTRLNAQPESPWHDAIAEFDERNAYWLDDYLLFRALRSKFQQPWWEWPEDYRDRHPPTMDAIRKDLAEKIAQVHFTQFLFDRQWKKLKAYANDRGVRLFGDMPIFVAHDSAEVWANRDWFFLDEEGHPTVVAGVPPDYFSETGQRWGNPLYRWDRMRADQFTFWVRRVLTQLALFDMVRLDHFRGFEAYWEIPAEEESAINGKWVKTPGAELFHRLFAVFGELPLVAEDLGVITPEVEELRDEFGLPGMKILQFAFSGDDDNPYLPENHSENSVVYTGTHDNDTTLGWFNALGDEQKAEVARILESVPKPMPWQLIHAAFESVCRLAVIPMQDLLELDGAHRMNLPGTIDGNWIWRFTWDQLPDGLEEELRSLVRLNNRESVHSPENDS